MIAHEEDELILREVKSAGQQGDAVVGLPVGIADACDTEVASAAQRAQEGLQPLGLVAGDDVEVGEAGLARGRDRPLDKR